MSKADEIYLWLKEQFARDAISIGDRLPSEPELARQFSTSRPLVRQALARLVHESLVETRQGKGSYRSARLSDHTEAVSSDIAVVLPNLSDYIYPELVEAAGTAIRKGGFQALFACSEGSAEVESEILTQFFTRNIGGLIISPICPGPNQILPNLALLHHIKTAGVPILLLDHEASGFSSLFLDDYEAGRQAARYLYERGHRHCTVCWREGHRPFYFRAQGYIDELKHLNNPRDPVYIDELLLPNGPEAGWYKLMREYVLQRQGSTYHAATRGQLNKSQSQLPLAVFCANDTMALALRRIALELGLQIPQDLSLIGFDDSPLVRLREIDLTSFRYPSRYLGERAVDLLFDQITNRTFGPCYTIKIMPPLIERSSVWSELMKEPL
ncbi:GntR family transcriptional regulator [Gracilinema caldarium]|uniref:GntR family transcriptional regulator n=1 Tax=Gracilinema caldarium TaxID=215591 RepID=UPI00030BDE35|nr:substrate-binding domain-containing protein [Gracilinema caldarium]